MNILELLIQRFGADSAWWIYAIAAAIPLCVLLALREFICWFFKFNKMIHLLERIDGELEETKERAKNIESAKVMPIKKASPDDFTLG